MIKGLWNSLSGMLPRLTRQDLAANNLANVTTTGYKKDRAFLQSFLDAEMMAEINRSTQHRVLDLEDIKTDHSQGLMQETGNPLDLGILGNGFFAIETDQGERYTRNGNFMLNAESQLVTADGNRVLDEGGGYIYINEGQVFVDERGQINIDNEPVATLRVVDFDDLSKLKKIANNLFAPELPNIQPRQAENFQIKHGFLERSNVNPVEEMVNMIVYFRNYEADSRILQAQDDTLRRAVNDVGRA